MNARCDRSTSFKTRVWAALATTAVGAALAAMAGLVWLSLDVSPAWAQRPATDKHVRELSRYLDGVQIAEPATYRHLAVYPLLAPDVPLLHGRWLSLDAAISRGVLVATEKGGGSVPVLWVENNSRDEYVFLMTGEVIAGGMQTRTVRNDTILAPGQKIDLEVFCVEAHRWSGERKFASGSKTMLPQSIQGRLRSGSGQSEVWTEVDRNNNALKSQNATSSLDEALKAAPVRRKLEDVRHKIAPEIPAGTVGFIFVGDGRPLGMELFGSEELARQLLPKLLDSYAVDYVILREAAQPRDSGSDNRTAIDLFEQFCRAGSQRTATPGSGSGVRTRQDGLLGDGVGIDGTVVHYGLQLDPKAARPRSHKPTIIYPPQERVQSNQR